MTSTAGSSRAVVVTLGLAAVGLAAAAIGVGAAYKPLYLILFTVAAGFLVVLVHDPAIGLALFTLLTFFGELGHGASPAKAVGALIVLAWVLKVIRRDSPAPFLGSSRPVAFYLAVAIALWAGASSLWATDAGSAHTTAFRLALNLMLFIVVPSLVNTRRDLYLLLRAYVFGAAITAVYGIASGNAASDAAGRLAGGIGDPNELAAILIPAIVLGFLLMSLDRRPLMRVALLASILTSGAAIIASQSRGGILALGAATAAGLVWARRGRLKILLGVAGLGLTTAVLVLIGVIGLGRFSSFGGGGTGRVDTWSVALAMFRNHPLNGVGVGNFSVVEPSYAAINVNLTRVDLVLDLQKVTHNTYLNILADLGLVGLALFVLLIVLVLRALWQRARAAVGGPADDVQAIARGLLVSLIGLLAAYVFISAQYEKQLWLLLGLGLAAAGTTGAARVRASEP